MWAVFGFCPQSASHRLWMLSTDFECFQQMLTAFHRPQKSQRAAVTEPDGCALSAWFEHCWNLMWECHSWGQSILAVSMQTLNPAALSDKINHNNSESRDALAVMCDVGPVLAKTRQMPGTPNPDACFTHTGSLKTSHTWPLWYWLYSNGCMNAW